VEWDRSGDRSYVDHQNCSLSLAFGLSRLLARRRALLAVIARDRNSLVIFSESLPSARCSREEAHKEYDGENAKDQDVKHALLEHTTLQK
jgi:hypothetical protein